jgi:hypothetical protein
MLVSLLSEFSLIAGISDVAGGPAVACVSDVACGPTIVGVRDSWKIFAYSFTYMSQCSPKIEKKL